MLRDQLETGHPLRAGDACVHVTGKLAEGAPTLYQRDELLCADAYPVAVDPDL